MTSILHTRILQSSSGKGTPLVFLHGLFGYGRNWQGIAREFPKHPIILADLRNHGQSFHDSDLSISAMAKDLENLRKHLKGNTFGLIGHSLGGKVAMQYAMDYGENLESLVILDIAPKNYPLKEHRFFIDTLLTLDLKKITSRQDADHFLKAAIPNLAVRQFLLSNLRQLNTPEGQKIWQWQMNLEALSKGLSQFQKMPPPTTPFTDCPVHFIGGELSDYIQREDVPLIKSYFPQAQCQWIKNAGHWLHADQPTVLVEKLKNSLAF